MSRFRFSPRFRRNATPLRSRQSLPARRRRSAEVSKIYFVHAATDAGVPMVRASRATIDEALRQAESELSGGAAFVWIVDGDGRLILPADEIKARLGRSARAP